jgi:carbamoylphosphate synthase large subunit
MTLKNKKILFIGGGFEQLEVIKNAKKYSKTIIVTNPEPNDEIRKYTKHIEMLDPLDIPKGEKIFKKYKPDAVITDACDYSNYLKNYLCTKYNLPCEGLKQAALSCNKFLVREICREKLILQPKYELCSSVNDLNIFLEKTQLPLIVKPIDNRGSIGVNIIRNKKELNQKFFHTLTHSASRQIIAEAYIEGKHVTLDGVFDNEGNFFNLAIAEKKVEIIDDHPVITEVNYPANTIEMSLRKELEQINSQIIESLNFKKGLTHTEFIIDKRKRIFLVETTNRGGGVLTSSVILKKLTAINISDYLIKNALGLRQNLKIKKSSSFVRLKFLKFKSGKIKKINHDIRVKNLLNFRINLKPGNTISPAKSGDKRHGFVIFFEKNLKKLDQSQKKILKKIKIIYGK